MSLSVFPEPRFKKEYTPGNIFGLTPATYSAIIHLAQQVVSNNQMGGAVTLADGTTMSTDASLGSDFFVTIAGNRTIATPTNPTSIQRIRYWITQDLDRKSTR